MHKLHYGTLDTFFDVWCVIVIFYILDEILIYFVLNSDQTEAIHFSLHCKKVAEELNSLGIGQSIITPSHSVCNLGVHFEFSGT